ncbi:MAG: hypothetical protein WCK09_22580, partial [Bacteroidota bacterium]
MIRKIILLLIISSISVLSFSQEILTENQKLESLCKVWGFLKYYHPAVIKGKIDWDQQLVKFIPAVISAKDQQELSNLYLGWINSLGSISVCKKCQRTVIPDSLKRNLDMKWLENRNLFSDSLIAAFNVIRDNRGQHI